MKRSSKRIFTTHVGRLQRPEKLTNAMEALPGGRPADPDFAAQLKTAVADVVRQQADAGVDIVNDSEFGKLSRNSYLNGRLGGHEIVPGEGRVRRSRDREEFAQFYRDLESGGSYYYRSPGRDAPWVWSGPAPGR